jgi:hypothetical protein
VEEEWGDAVVGLGGLLAYSTVRYTTTDTSALLLVVDYSCSAV